jgi:hypothetical protein
VLGTPRAAGGEDSYKALAVKRWLLAVKYFRSAEYEEGPEIEEDLAGRELESLPCKISHHCATTRRATLPLALLLPYDFDHNGYCACCSFSELLNYTQCIHMSAVPDPESALRSFGSNRADGAREGERGAANDVIRELLKVTFRTIGYSPTREIVERRETREIVERRRERRERDSREERD